MTATVYRIGPFELRPATRELLAGDAPQRLGERAFDILLALAEADGAVVTRETLFERAWPGRVVLEDNLKVQVMALRRLLGAEAIVTVPRRGYRLTLAVDPLTPGPRRERGGGPATGRASRVPDARGNATAGGEPPASAASTLFGRRDELARLASLLVPGALVTVVGPGGIGKTRLALAAAAASRFDDGTVVVELAPLADARALPATVARALGLPPIDREPALLAALRPLSLLLVLDNAEHLRDDVAALALALQAAAPRLALLVTSQEPLALADEQVLRLDGLALPASDDPAAVRSSPAVALFLARARAAQATTSAPASDPTRGPTPRTASGAAPSGVGARNDADDAAHDGAEDGAEDGADDDADLDGAATVAEVCRRLDGIPLALELAAARVPLLGVVGVLDKLGEPLALLTRGARREIGAPPRQQTLRAALQWSHALLDAPQKVVFRRLAVFAGSFTLEAAQQVAGDAALDDWSVLDQLEALVAKSLVQVLVDGDRRRFRLLESARRFALERLHDAGEAEHSARRHAEAMCALFEAADDRYAATPTLPWLRELLPELPNLRAAVQWALGPDGDEALAIALCAAAGSFWALAGMAAESGPPLQRLAPRVDERVPLATRARFWLAVANRGGDSAFGWRETYEAAERAVALAREAGLNALLHRALFHRLPLAQRVGVAIDAAATAAEMRAIEGAEWNTLQRRARRASEAFASFQQGDWERFGELERAELARLRDAGDLYRAWFVAHRLALAETALGRGDAAVALMEPAVEEIRAEGCERQCWQQVAMLAMAWIEAGRAPAATVHEAVRLMHGAGAMSWMACHLAEWLTQRRQFADAARLLGWLARRHAERSEAPSGHGERARERALAALRGSAEESRIAAWRVEGEAWADDDAAQALLAVRDAAG